METNIKPNNPEELIKKYRNKMKMLWGDPVFDFIIHDGNIYINKYYDNKDRQEVKIPEFVYGFLTRKTPIEVGAFFNCRYIEKIIGTSKIHGSLDSIFYRLECDSLTLENFDTSKVYNMSCMFYECGQREMKEINLGDKFNTENVTNMHAMFAYCGKYKLEELNLGDKFSTKNVKDMSFMFQNCGIKQMKKLNLGNNFNTSNVEDMEWIFIGIEDKLIYRNGNKINIKKFESTLGKEQ